MLRLRHRNEIDIAWKYLENYFSVYNIGMNITLSEPFSPLLKNLVWGEWNVKSFTRRPALFNYIPSEVYYAVNRNIRIRLYIRNIYRKLRLLSDTASILLLAFSIWVLKDKTLYPIWNLWRKKSTHHKKNKKYLH